MFETLTKFIDRLENEEICELEDDGLNDNEEGTIIITHITYKDVVYELEDEVYKVLDNNPDLVPNNDYMSVIQEYANGDTNKMYGKDTKDMNAKVAFAYILSTFRAERFYDGAIKSSIEDKRMINWLKKLKEYEEL